MGSIAPNSPRRDFLPTLAQLKASVPEDLNAPAIAQEWLTRFSDAVKAKDVSKVLATCHPEGWWRDIVALTWDIRTFQGLDKIGSFLNDRLTTTDFAITSGVALAIPDKPYPDVIWIVAQFTFTTAGGSGTATTFLVPSSTDQWQTFIVSTNLDSIKNSPERFGSGRDSTPARAHVWYEARLREQAFEDRDPEVLIVGAGQSGLAVAARLKNLGVTSVVVDKNTRIGDQWRNRYDSLRLHDFVWAGHMPYIKFPDSFPVHIPAKKLADWYEFYAKAMDLNVWTSTMVSKASRDETTGKWSVTVLKPDGTERTLHVDHLVFGTGWVGDPKIPEIPGRDEFRGDVVHSSAYKNAQNYVGKKVVVVGACTSAHDVAVDCADLNIDVTLLQRSETLMVTVNQFAKLYGPYKEGGPPTELADQLTLATPLELHRPRGRRDMAEFVSEDADRRAKLEKLGYKMHTGEDETGAVWQIFTRGGGQYIDQGACDLMIEGKIKIKSGTQLERFTRNGLRFADGSELQADLVVFATGWGDLRDPIKRVIGPDLGQKLTKIWGLDDDGELNSIAKEVGIPGLWYLSGSLLYSRIYSKPLALQIKARQAGVFTGRYACSPVY